jgi:phenylalanyl-tRNA synthetase beta chain
MLCAEAELGMAESSDGLMELPDSAPVGQDIRVYLGLDDAIIDVDLTPNRGDCLSIAGMAREVGVLNQVPVNGPVINAVPPSISQAPEVQVLAPDACPRYLGRIIQGINVNAETPLWMVEKLRRSGIRSIDAVVDITNYVLLELGQPMHAFDLNKVEGGIRVRMAEQGEKLTLLDGQEIELNSDTLMIADHAKPLAIAGIMGGEFSGVSGDTQSLLLEAAFSTASRLLVKHVVMACIPIHRTVLSAVSILNWLAPRWSVRLSLLWISVAASPAQSPMSPVKPTYRLRPRFHCVNHVSNKCLA